LVFLALAVRVFAHHSVSAEFDDKKSVNLKGIVTKFDWTNPHVYAFVDLTDARGQVTNWAVELESRIELRRIGWTGDSLKAGDSVTVDGYAARDGSHRSRGKSFTLANGKKLNAVAGAPQPPAASSVSKPLPRTGDHPGLGGSAGEV